MSLHSNCFNGNYILARVLREVPAVDVGHFFFKPKDVGDFEWSSLVHMTAKDSFVGRTHSRELKRFISANSRHHFLFWSDGDICDFMLRYFGGTKIYSVFCNVKQGIVRADIFRICVLKIFGGLYFDLKSNTSCPLSGFELGVYDAVLTEECHSIDFCGGLTETDSVANVRKQIIANWFFGFSPGHWFLDEMLYDICASDLVDIAIKRNLSAFEVWTLSGPRMVTRCFYNGHGKFENLKLIAHDDRFHKLNYACKGSWVRTVLSQHYSKEYKGEGSE